MTDRKTKNVDWYEHPRYYDMLFREDTMMEADFIEAACGKYCDFPVRHIAEPGCGTGRLVIELASRGFELSGFDLSRSMLSYLKKRLSGRKLKADVFVGDMVDFQLSRPADAAFNLINTFRHLLTEEDSRRHLECVAHQLVPGGIYLLGFHLLPLDVDEESTERWVATHGKTRVTGTLKVKNSDRQRRIEEMRICLHVREGESVKRFRHDFDLRMYTAQQFESLLGSVPQFELVDVFDFWYELDHPLTLDDEITDSVFVLRKRD